MKETVALVDRFTLDYLVETLPIIYSARRHGAPLLALRRDYLGRRRIGALRIGIGSQLREQRIGFFWVSDGNADAHVHVERRRAPDFESRNVGGRLLPRADQEILGRPVRIRQCMLPSVTDCPAHV